MAGRIDYEVSSFPSGRVDGCAPELEALRRRLALLESYRGLTAATCQQPVTGGQGDLLRRDVWGNPIARPSRSTKHDGSGGQQQQLVTAPTRKRTSMELLPSHQRRGHPPSPNSHTPSSPHITHFAHPQQPLFKEQKQTSLPRFEGSSSRASFSGALSAAGNNSFRSGVGADCPWAAGARGSQHMLPAPPMPAPQSLHCPEPFRVQDVGGGYEGPSASSPQLHPSFHRRSSTSRRVSLSGPISGAGISSLSGAHSKTCIRSLSSASREKPSFNSLGETFPPARRARRLSFDIDQMSAEYYSSRRKSFSNGGESCSASRQQPAMGLRSGYTDHSAPFGHPSASVKQEGPWGLQKCEPLLSSDAISSDDQMEVHSQSRCTTRTATVPCLSMFPQPSRSQHYSSAMTKEMPHQAQCLKISAASECQNTKPNQDLWAAALSKAPRMIERQGSLTEDAETSDASNDSEFLFNKDSNAQRASRQRRMSLDAMARPLPLN